MNPTTITLTISIGAAVVGFIFGHAIGFSRGKATGWMDHYFEVVRRDRARRDRNGQFRSRIAIQASGTTQTQQEASHP